MSQKNIDILKYRKLVIATRNKGKTIEIKELLGEIPFELVSLSDFTTVGLAEELEDSYEGNAVAKARFYAEATGKLALADDSGLEVQALNGAPGVLSARYAGLEASDEERRQKLLTALAAAPGSDRTARFVCAVAIAAPNEEILKVTLGVCEGSIAFAGRGISGFGYDPIFVPANYKETFGQLPEVVKNRISHRAKAVRSMREFLLEQ